MYGMIYAKREFLSTADSSLWLRYEIGDKVVIVTSTLLGSWEALSASGSGTKIA